MDLSLSVEDTELTAALDALLTKESSPARVREAESLGHDEQLWRALTSIGVPGLAVGEDAATAQQLVLVNELAGRHLASVPLVEGLVAARLLDRVGSAGRELLTLVEDGEIATVVLHPARGGRARVVPGGAVATLLVHHDDDRLVAVRAEAPMAALPNLAGAALADRDLTAGTASVLAEGARAAELQAAARHDWQLLTAAQLVGVAARALEIGAAYAKERVIFDTPVAAFQTVSHRLADHATAVDGARLLVQEAAWALDEGDPRARSLATMAFCFASEHAVAVAGDALHYHGGYGFTLEYDIQLYYRRARALPLVWGSVQREYQALADQLYGKVGA